MSSFMIQAPTVFHGRRIEDSAVRQRRMGLAGDVADQEEKQHGL